MSAPEMLKKFTVKNVAGKLEAPAEGKKELVTVIGRVVNAEMKETNYGPYVRFKGSFAAYTPDGKQYRSSNAIFPEVWQDQIAAPFFADNPPANLDFAVKLGIKASDTPVGYEFYAEPVVDMDESSDPLAEIMAKAQHALPKPTATEPEPEKSKGRSAKAEA